jgi:hypothetical protein
MKILRRILITIVVTLAVIFVGVYWVAPVALSFYAARKALPVAKVVPADLKDKSVSEAPGTKLSYFSYEFEVPWTDLDESKTALYPKDKPEKTRAVLTFHSGLRLMVSFAPPREFANQFATDFKMPPESFEAVFGRGTAKSDYDFVKNVYEFTPSKMHYWSLSSGVHVREMIVLLIKSIMPSKPAETGIFNIQNGSYRGFQQGNSQIRQDKLLVDLFSDDGGVEFIFFQKDYHCSTGVTQPEINRIIQTLHKAPAGELSKPQTAAWK